MMTGVRATFLPNLSTAIIPQKLVVEKLSMAALSLAPSPMPLLFNAPSKW